MIVNLQKNLNKITDPSFLYWHQSMFPIYLKNIMEEDVDLERLSVSLIN